MDEALKENSDNTHHYIICTGEIATFTSAVAVCNKKVITENIGQLVFSAFVTLLAIYFAYELDFNSNLKQMLEFLQEKLLGQNLSLKKTSTAYLKLICIDRWAVLAEDFGYKYTCWGNIWIRDSGILWLWLS